MIVIIKHISIEGPGIIGEFFQNTKWQIEIVELQNGGKLPGDFASIEAIISLGGPMNVYEEDRFPFLKEEDILLRGAIKRDIPILGICLGAQLLAKACGAEVKKAERQEIGWYKASLTKEGVKDPLFFGTSNELDVFQWHQDTFAIPEGATLLTTANLCKNQAFRFGKNVYGLQFHIEVTPSMVESWLNEYLDGENQSEIITSQKMLIDTYKKKEQFEKQAKKVLLNFSRLFALKIAAVS
ncbi:MAG: type 1 glutamine amidotransferase [Candidatus Omnitrophica bacterium]|nr:type 1 glutamine amidotransferase [Candidatus Omnitrophota bacterium]